MRGEIWWADVQGHQRPYLILQAEALNQVAPTVIALPVTVTRQHAGPPLTIALPTDVTELAQDTWVRVTHPITLRRSQLDAPAATLAPDVFKRVIDAFVAVLGPATDPLRAPRSLTTLICWRHRPR